MLCSFFLPRSHPPPFFPVRLFERRPSSVGYHTSWFVLYPSARPPNHLLCLQRLGAVGLSLSMFPSAMDHSTLGFCLTLGLEKGPRSAACQHEGSIFPFSNQLPFFYLTATTGLQPVEDRPPNFRRPLPKFYLQQKGLDIDQYPSYRQAETRVL